MAWGMQIRTTRRETEGEPSAIADQRCNLDIMHLQRSIGVGVGIREINPGVCVLYFVATLRGFWVVIAGQLGTHRRAAIRPRTQSVLSGLAQAKGMWKSRETCVGFHRSGTSRNQVFHVNCLEERFRTKIVWGMQIRTIRCETEGESIRP